ncbi:hypothetical protein ACFQ21_00220 [Ohtaekwangia kribbensis]|uniref:Uncharacterized protein n=1 Tax=Ohtaekwangia kribbensis TaxID=688913 RepID=A0ABW3JV30_9BACT
MEFNIKIQDKLSKAIEKMRAATEQLQEKEFKRILVIGDINGEPPYILTPIIDSIKKSLDRSPPQRKNPFVYSNSESWRKRRK